MNETTPEEFGVLIVALIQGGFFGAIYGGLGYWQLRPPGEAFNGKKFTRAILVGAIVGVFATYRGLPLPTAETELHMQAAGAGVLLIGSFIIDQAAGKLWEWVEAKVLPRIRRVPVTPA